MVVKHDAAMAEQSQKARYQMDQAKMTLEKRVREKEEENDMLKTKHEKDKYDMLLKQNKLIINLEEQLRSAKQQERTGTSDLL